ncbi:deoxyribodipyrimidine photolyase [Actibacterium mucosum KCTC 23349]|uniref:Deoxyribodipyrimidine photolyase n=1 Tax=Actibacterium mucosum KCTC 23349 TaxID=1454373 RepID=A0A037ZIA3_9RHOB|nr:deoxyribodipyrimidine photo-lyase [Actibacterium mucosum]KAJ55833.1 deoxyribodipyrimidine photolyase [Actibacterium mucosum KCTC 23349]
MSDRAPVLWWARRDLRLADNAALSAAVASSAPVIPVFLFDEAVAGLGRAAAWRLAQSLASLDADLRAQGSRLILRRGDGLPALQRLIAETGARGVFWTRSYDPDTISRDTRIKAAFSDAGIAARSFGGQLLFEPSKVRSGAGEPYKVFTPFWRAIRAGDVGAKLPTPDIPSPANWPASDPLNDWALDAGMRRGAAVVARHVAAGEGAAMDTLQRFVSGPVRDYAERRDLLAGDGTSTLSAHLSLGEISARQVWQAGQGPDGAEPFVRQVAWREFAWHLLVDRPDMATENWRDGWDGFPWIDDASHPDLIAWQRAQTGVDVVDAAMRELYATGRMHNRARMITASYLTKHLMIHWRHGLNWFEDTLIDWDKAANAMGWQWVAGCGPDAAPYFRIFNPDTQAAKFDPDGVYRNHWLSGSGARDFAAAVPVSWSIDANAPRPIPRPLAEGRARALQAYQAHRADKAT